jgi:integrase
MPAVRRDDGLGFERFALGQFYGYGAQQLRERRVRDLANNFDVKWVMSQVGHADSKMTMDVYAQLEQRAKRSHGNSFDRLIRDARDQLSEDTTDTAPADVQWAPKRRAAYKR